MMNNIISQDFWAVTLTKDNRECVWQHDDDEISHHLMIEQIVLGLNCKDKCMVEATSRLTNGEERSTMICQLIPNSVPNCKLSLSFKQVKVRLAAGEGPVYLTGTHSQEIDDMGESEDEEAPQLVEAEAEESGEESEEESESDQEGLDQDKMLEELAAAQANKLKTFMKKDKKAVAAAKPGPLSKKDEKKEEAEKKDVEMEEVDTPAVAEEKEAEESSDEEDDDEDDDDEDDDDEDDDDEDDDKEEVESDDEEEEGEEESEEESEEETPVNKKRKTNDATPAPVKSVTNGAKPVSTPKQNKKPQTPVKLNMNELKKKLLASPSLPKKFDKFVNLMKHAHKVTDEKEIKNTWEFLQKNKK